MIFKLGTNDCGGMVSIVCCYLLRSVDLWIKGCVKSRAFLLRRRTCFPSPSACARTSQRTVLSTNTSSSLHSLFLFFLPGTLLLVGYAPVNYVKAWLSLMNQCLVDCTHKFLSQSPRGKLAIFHGFVLYITQVSEKRLVKTLHRTSSGIGNLIQAPIVPTRKKWPIQGSRIRLVRGLVNFVPALA